MTTTRRLPGGEVVILWEAQVSPLGLHSKRWLAHHNEFLPETKPKQVSKVPKIQATCNVVRRRPKRDTPHGLGYRGCVRGTQLLYISPWVTPTPQQPMLSMFTSMIVWPVSRILVPRPRVFALPVSGYLPLLNRVTSTLHRTSRDMVTGGGWRGEGAWT